MPTQPSASEALTPAFYTWAGLLPWLLGLWIGLLVGLPWLGPWSVSPQPNTLPLLLSWACTGLLLLCAARIKPLDVARAWAWAALISSALGLIQYFGAASVLSPWLHVPQALGEASANLRQRNLLASLLAIGCLAVLWWQAHGLKTRHALWMLALLAIGNAATASRTGFFHMLLVLALGLYWFWLKFAPGQAPDPSSPSAKDLAPHLAIWALLIYLLSNWALPSLLGTFSGQDMASAVARMGQDEGCGSRAVLWGNVWHLIGQKPWTGWGWGELKYAHYITAYGGGPAQRFCDILGHAHNLPLHLAVTLGLPFTLGLGLLLLLGVARLRPWLSRLPDQQLAWSVLAVIGLHSLLEFPLWYGPFQMAVLLCGVLLTAHTTGLKTRTATGLGLGFGSLILVVVCMLGADYARASQIYLPAAQRWSFWRNQPLAAAQSSWFFQPSSRFAELTLTRVTPENAPWVLATSQDMLHYSPEPQVVRLLLQSAQALGRQDLVSLHTARWQAAFPSHPLPITQAGP